MRLSRGYLAGLVLALLTASSIGAADAQHAVRIIYDTDIGNDIDDALAMRSGTGTSRSASCRPGEPCRACQSITRKARVS
jgi:hypothetical protein